MGTKDCRGVLNPAFWLAMESWGWADTAVPYLGCHTEPKAG